MSVLRKFLIVFFIFIVFGGYASKCIQAASIGTAAVKFKALFNDGNMDHHKRKGCFVFTVKGEALAQTTSDCSIEDIARVIITITGPGIDSPIEVELAQSAPGEPYTGSRSNLPDSVELTFTGQAKDEFDEVIFQGSTTATLEAAKTSIIAMTLACVYSIDGNYLPTVSLKINEEWYLSGEEVPIEIKLGDKDNDQLEYEISDNYQYLSFSKTSGSISLVDHLAATETTITNLVAERDYEVTVKVNDQSGGIALANIIVRAVISSVHSITMIPFDLNHPYNDTGAIGVDDSMQLAITGEYFGYTRDLTPMTIWSSNDTSVVSIDSNGLVTGISLGTADIAADIVGLERKVTLTVIDAIKVAEGVHLSDYIQMAFNPYNKGMEVVYTKLDYFSNLREVWYGFIGEDIIVDQIGHCYHDCRWCGSPISIAVNLDTNQPAVAYWDPNKDLIFAQLTDSLWQKEMAFDSRFGILGYYFGLVGENCSLAFNPLTNCPGIAFNSVGDWNLKYVERYSSAWHQSGMNYCDADFECLRFHPETGEECISYYDWYGFCGRGLHFYGGGYDSDVDLGSGVGKGNCLAFDQAGNPHISYYAGDESLKHAWWDGTEWKKEVVDDEIGYISDEITSMAIDANDRIYISYIGFYDLRSAYFDGNQWITEVVCNSRNYDFGEWSSLVLDDQGNVNIAFITSDRVWVTTRKPAKHWNNDGDFNLTPYDTGENEDECHIDAPWSNASWGIIGMADSLLPDVNLVNCTLDVSEFIFNEYNSYLYGKEESGRFGLVGLVQGNILSEPIPWHCPDPLLVDGKDISLEITVERDKNNLLSPEGLIVFMIDLWLSSDELPEGSDINGRKSICIHLILYNSCDCGLEHSESEDTFSYQVSVGEIPYNKPRSLSIPLSGYIQEALDYQWPSGSIAEAKDTLKLYQMDFLMLISNAEAAVKIDDFYLKITTE